LSVTIPRQPAVVEPSDEFGVYYLRLVDEIPDAGVTDTQAFHDARLTVLVDRDRDGRVVGVEILT